VKSNHIGNHVIMASEQPVMCAKLTGRNRDLECQKLSPLFAALTVGAKKTFDSKNVILKKS